MLREGSQHELVMEFPAGKPGRHSAPGGGQERASRRYARRLRHDGDAVLRLRGLHALHADDEQVEDHPELRDC